MGSNDPVDWASRAQYKIDLEHMAATGRKLTPPIEAPTTDADPDPAGLSAEPEEDPNNKIDFYAMLDLGDTFEDPFAMGPEGSSEQLFPMNLLADIGDNEMPVYPVIPDDMDVDDLYSFFAASPARNMGDGEGSSNISATGQDTEMKDDDTDPEGKLVREMIHRVRDRSVQPEVAEQEDSGERPVNVPLVEVSSLDQNSHEPETTAGEANLARDELRNIHNGLRFNMFANDDDDDDSDLSPPPDSPDFAMLDIEETHVTEEPATATVDWRIKFAADLLSGPITRQRLRPSDREVATGSDSSEMDNAERRKAADTSGITAAATSAPPADGGSDIAETNRDMVPDCSTCSEYFRKKSPRKIRGESVSCCQKSAEYVGLVSRLLNGTQEVPLSEDRYACGTEGAPCATCSSRKIRCWISKQSVDTFKSDLESEQPNTQSSLS